MVVVQHIRVVWTKASRGAPGAVVRNAVPAAVLIETAPLAPWVFHSVHFLERSGFKPESQHQFTRETHRERDRGLLLELLPDGLHVGFRWEPGVGQPPRHERREAFTLSVGGYARVIVNGRHAPDEGHWYTQETYNVVFGDVVDVDTFTARPPTEVLDLRETLF